MSTIQQMGRFNAANSSRDPRISPRRMDIIASRDGREEILVVGVRGDTVDYEISVKPWPVYNGRCGIDEWTSVVKDGIVTHKGVIVRNGFLSEGDEMESIAVGREPK